MINEFVIERNHYLSRDTKGYFHQYYTGFNHPGNPDFINVLKNIYNSESPLVLEDAQNKLISILMNDLPQIIKGEKLHDCLIVAIPRSKALISYKSNQLKLRESIKQVSLSLTGNFKGVDCFERVLNTKTTHIKNPVNYNNDGPEPYPGITLETCKVDRDIIKGRNILLIDDIYTKGSNIDEDGIETLYQCGANKVIFYSIGFTRR